MKTLYLFVFMIMTLSSCHKKVESLKVLAVFPYQGKSHFAIFKQYLEELANRGHNVTVVSSFPRQTPMNNYYDIRVERGDLENFMSMSEPSFLTRQQVIYKVLTIGLDNCKTLLANERVQNIWKSGEKYDVAVVEQFNTDCPLAIAYKLGAPVVGISTTGVMPHHFSRFGIPHNPSFTSYILREGGTRPTLLQRCERLLVNIITPVVQYISQKLADYHVAQYLDNIPPLQELARDIKILLLYQNFVLSGSNILPANVIEIGGFHVATAKPLPEDLRKFIEESKHGVIYVGFGTNLNLRTMNKEKLKIMIDALSSLPQRVIWKWDEDTPLPTDHFFISKWLPQNDILETLGPWRAEARQFYKELSSRLVVASGDIRAGVYLGQQISLAIQRGNVTSILGTMPQCSDLDNIFKSNPKVLAFFSHCGNLGITEAIHHGVPVLAMPFVGDQPGNAAAVVESGLGVQIDMAELTKEKLLEKFKIILNLKFRENVKMLSKAWKDRPTSPMDTAIFWTEFAAKYPNLRYRTRAADVPFYQYFCLDVIIILVVLLAFTFYVMKMLIHLIMYFRKKDISNNATNKVKRN